MAKNQIELRPTYWASFSGGKDSFYMLYYILSKPFSVWASNPKYNTEYRMKRVDEILANEAKELLQIY